MSEIALVASRRARLQQKAEEGHPGAQVALDLANSPNQFLSTIQIGITLVGVLAGAFGGATIAERLAAKLSLVAWLAPHAGIVSYGLVVVGITYLSLVIGELVPKRIALNHAERISAALAPAMRTLSRVTRLRSFTCSAIPPIWSCGSSGSTSLPQARSPRRRSG